MDSPLVIKLFTVNGRQIRVAVAQTIEMRRNASNALGSILRNVVNSVNPPFPPLSFKRQLAKPIEMAVNAMKMVSRYGLGGLLMRSENVVSERNRMKPMFAALRMRSE